ncbi:MAG: acyl carrier protein [Ruminiclostridium sp.]|jgi:acyl carrier protein|nr:acyl carrier protein [Ruminiclostridium sp.]MCI9466008.1 acyl carrier protein [Ruminiclostridium sp.]
MDRASIFEKLTEVFQDVFDDDSIALTDDTTAADIEDWDSLTHITLLATVEEEFGMKFSMKAVQGMKNVGEMVDLIAAAV